MIWVYFVQSDQFRLESGSGIISPLLYEQFPDNLGCGSSPGDAAGMYVALGGAPR